MIRPGCFFLAVIVIIAAIIAGIGLTLSSLEPVLKAQQSEQGNK